MSNKNAYVSGKSGAGANSIKTIKGFRVHINNREVHDIMLGQKDSMRDLYFILGERMGVKDLSFFSKFELKLDPTAQGTSVNLEQPAKNYAQVNDLYLFPPYDRSNFEKNRIFGIPLEEACAKEIQMNGLTPQQQALIKGIPFVLVKCFEFLEKERILRTIGLFRLNGNKQQVERFKTVIDETGTQFEGFPSNIDPHTISSLVKEFLIDLPHALVPETFHAAIFSAVMDPHSTNSDENDILRRRKLKAALQKLSPSSFRVLKFIFEFFVTLCMYTAKNLITYHNIAIVMGPLLFRKPAPANASNLPTTTPRNNPNRKSMVGIAPGSSTTSTPPVVIGDPIATPMTPEQKETYSRIFGCCIEHFTEIFDVSSVNGATSPTSKRGRNLSKFLKPSPRGANKAPDQEDVDDEDDDNDDTDDGSAKDMAKQVVQKQERQVADITQKTELIGNANPPKAPAVSGTLRSFVNQLNQQQQTSTTNANNTTATNNANMADTMARRLSATFEALKTARGMDTAKTATSIEDPTMPFSTQISNDEIQNIQKTWQNVVAQWKTKYNAEVDARKLEQLDWKRQEEAAYTKQKELEQKIRELAGQVEHTKLMNKRAEDDKNIEREKLQIEMSNLRREREEIASQYEKQIKELKKEHLLVLRHYGIEDGSSVDPSQKKLTPQFFQKMNEMKQKVHGVAAVVANEEENEEPFRPPPPSSKPSTAPLKDTSSDTNLSGLQDKFATKTKNRKSAVGAQIEGLEEMQQKMDKEPEVSVSAEPIDPEKQCYICRKQISGEWMEANNRKYHRDCFKCTSCQNVINGAFADKGEGQLVCKGCLQEQAKQKGGNVTLKQNPASTVKTTSGKSIQTSCEHCGNSVPAGSKIVALGKTYHKECFKCAQCGSEFENMKFFALNDLPVCVNCKKASLKK